MSMCVLGTSKTTWLLQKRQILDSVIFINHLTLDPEYEITTNYNFIIIDNLDTFPKVLQYKISCLITHYNKTVFFSAQDYSCIIDYLKQKVSIIIS